MNYKDCTSFEELQILAAEKGFKKGWAYYKARELNLEIPKNEQNEDKKLSKDYRECLSLEDLKTYAKQRNYKPGWIYHAAMRLGIPFASNSSAETKIS